MGRQVTSLGRTSRLAGYLASLGLLAAAQAQEPLVTENPTDKSTYDRRTWFRVPAVLVSGTSAVAVKIHQHRVDSSDVGFELTLSGEPLPTALPPELLWGRFSGGDVLAWSDPRFRWEWAEQITRPWLRLDDAWSPFWLRPGARERSTA